jgi:hypothetical protein
VGTSTSLFDYRNDMSVFAVADIADVIMLFSIILLKFLITKRTVKYDEETMWIK